MSASDAILAVVPLGLHWPTLDPFLFCAHHDDAYPRGDDAQGPAASLAGRRLGEDFEGADGWRMYHGHRVPGFPQHPHRGFETVTVVRRGLVDHSDSLGAAAHYGEGDVQWLTAGRGILHSEMFPLVERGRPNPLELFQIWLNLPRESKLVPPHFSMLWAPTIPRGRSLDEAGRATQVTIVAGAWGELTPRSPPPNSWAARSEHAVAIWTLQLEAHARFRLPSAPSGAQRMLYFFSGTGLAVGGQSVPPYHGVALRGDAELLLEAADEPVELLLLQGRPIGEPVVSHGPFVMTSREEIRATIVEYQATQFGGWPWPSDEPVHPREGGRFARRPDGLIERP